MATVILDPADSERLITQRRETGADRYDEVWDGVYVMAPMANNEHQLLATTIASVVLSALPAGSALVFAGTNVSDREIDWTQNYRCPDVAVFLQDTRAENRDTHWFGGPDFAVEIISQHDRSREKLDFYTKVGTHELLIVDRYPWAMELYRLNAGKLALTGVSTLADSRVLVSEVLPLTWQLVAGVARPAITVAHSDGKQSWTI